MRLLHDFKAARGRRDETTFGSPEWAAAEDEIQELQREIFDLTLEDSPGNGHYQSPHDVAAGFGPDDELEQPEDPSAF